MTAPEPLHAWLSRALLWWGGLTLGLALRYSCFCDNGTELASSDASRLLAALWTDGIQCGLSCMGEMWLQWTLRALMMWVIYLWPHSRDYGFHAGWD